MDLESILRDLREEKELLDAAIIAIERLASGSGKRRGRPPNWLIAASIEPETEGAPRKRVFSAEARKRMSEAQRKRFAGVRAKAESA